MSLLSEIMQYAPDHWDYSYSYCDRRFVKIALRTNSFEYLRIRDEFLEQFNNVKIVNIERIQHPFAFARFHIRKEQLTKQNRGPPNENRKFVPITDAKAINTIIEFNCDFRRGGFNLSSHIKGNGYVLVMKMLGKNFDGRDTHRYPEYILKYHSAAKQRSYNNNNNHYVEYDDLFDQFGRFGLY